MTPETLTRRLREDARLLMQGEIGMALGLRYHEDTLKQAAEAIESQAAALTAERARAERAEQERDGNRNEANQWAEEHAKWRTRANAAGADRDREATLRQEAEQKLVALQVGEPVLRPEQWDACASLMAECDALRAQLKDSGTRLA